MKIAVALPTFSANFANASGLELSAKDKKILIEDDLSPNVGPLLS
jgi:hypothetical protein